MADLGLQSGTVNLVEYNKNWPKIYQDEAKNLAQTLDIPIYRIQHVGSTAVPGMVAKPILDIAILVDNLDIVDAWKEKLGTLGYWYKGIEKDLPDRRFFAKGPRSNRTVYIHVVNQREYDSLLKFRDALRSSPSLASEYFELKKKLAVTYANNRGAYTLSKNDFISKVLRD